VSRVLERPAGPRQADAIEGIAAVGRLEDAVVRIAAVANRRVGGGDSAQARAAAGCDGLVPRTLAVAIAAAENVTRAVDQRYRLIPVRTGDGDSRPVVRDPRRSRVVGVTPGLSLEPADRAAIAGDPDGLAASGRVDAAEVLALGGRAVLEGATILALGGVTVDGVRSEDLSIVAHGVDRARLGDADVPKRCLGRDVDEFPAPRSLGLWRSVGCGLAGSRRVGVATLFLRNSSSAAGCAAGFGAPPRSEAQ